jgi:hypothetical protein
MGQAFYDIAGTAGAWRVHHDSKAENVYETKEAALKPRSPPPRSLCVRGTRYA